MTHDSTPKVQQLRLVVEAEDFDAALSFYRDALGLTEQEAFEGDGEARVAILDAGRATLEIVNAAQRQMIDKVEVGYDVSPRIRVAFEVSDAETAISELTEAGGKLIAGPVETPWRSLNARLDGQAGLQITVFQELVPLDQPSTIGGLSD